MDMKILLILTLCMGLASAGLTVPSWTLSQESYGPGTNGIITLELANPLVTTADVRSVTGVTLEMTPPPEMTMGAKQFVGDIEAGGATKVSLPFAIKDDAKSAIYALEIKITGVADRPGGVGGFDTFSRRVIVPVTIVNEPILSFKTDKQLIGGIDQLALTAINNGGKADNVRVRIAPGSPVSFYGTDEIFMQSVTKSAASNITLDSRSASDGPTDISFIIEYNDELGIKRTDDTTLRMTVRNEKLDISFTQMSDVITKKDGALVLSIKNDGNVELKDVRLSFTDSVLRLKDSGELKFGDLAPGASATASGAVFADLPPGVNLVKSQLSYVEKDVQKEEARDLPLTITSDADVGVYLEAKPLPLTIGSEHTISVLVSNLGSYRIDNVDVSIDSPALRSLDISDKQYIGALQSDDFSTVQFLMQANASSEGSYPVNIKIAYRDQSGQWKSKVVKQDVSVYNPPSAQANPLPIIGGFALIAIAVWYFVLRKRK